MTRDAHAISAALAARIRELARELLPNGRQQGWTLRAGGLDGATGGSLAIALFGNHQGSWIDHATQEHGDALDLVKAVRRCSTSEALEWSRRWLGRYGGNPPRCPMLAIATMRAAVWTRCSRYGDEAIDPRRTLVETYLRGRALKLADALANKVIRFHRRCPWRDEAGRLVAGAGHGRRDAVDRDGRDHGHSADAAFVRRKEDRAAHARRRRRRGRQAGRRRTHYEAADHWRGRRDGDDRAADRPHADLGFSECLEHFPDSAACSIF